MEQEINRILEVGSSSDVPAAADSDVTAEKLGGWLWFPAIGLVLGCIVSAVSIVMSLGLASKMPSEYQGIFALGLLYSIGITIFLVYVAVRFFGRRRNAPSLMIALMITGVVGSGLLVAVSIASNAEPFAVEYAKALVKGIVGAVIWIPYFSVSKRVKRTFVIP